MLSFLPTLDNAQSEEALRQNHEAWGGGEPPARYIAAEEALRQSAHGIVTRAGLFQGGALVSSLERFSLVLSLRGEARAAVGFGSVYTPPSHRGSGLGTQLLRATLDHERAHGTELALLFSDIAPAFYERLGFLPYPAESFSCAPDTLPAPGALDTTPAAPGDLPRLLSWRATAMESAGVHCRSDPARWDFFHRKNHSPPPLLLHEDGHALGYLCAAPDPPGRLWVEELAAPGVPWPRIAATLRLLAAHTRCTSVAGWRLPAPLHAELPYTPRARSIPMLCDLTTRLSLPSLPPLTPHFWPSDHF